MEHSIIQFLNWEEYNPRNDVKHPSWFRFQHDLFYSSKFWDFDHEEIVCFVYLICEASRNEPRGQLPQNSDHAHRVARVKKEIFHRTIKKLKSNKVITVRTLRGRYADVLNPASTIHYITEQDVTLQKTLVQSDDFTILKLDFESLYKKYPRKLGKSSGLKKLTNTIKTQEEFQSLEAALGRFLDHHRKKETEERFIPHFSTWVNSWRDWSDPDAGIVQPIARSQKEIQEDEEHEKNMREHREEMRRIRGYD